MDISCCKNLLKSTCCPPSLSFSYNLSVGDLGCLLAAPLCLPFTKYLPQAGPPVLCSFQRSSWTWGLGNSLTLAPESGEWVPTHEGSRTHRDVHSYGGTEGQGPQWTHNRDARPRDPLVLLEFQPVCTYGVCAYGSQA